MVLQLNEIVKDLDIQTYSFYPSPFPKRKKNEEKMPGQGLELIIIKYRFDFNTRSLDDDSSK